MSWYSRNWAPYVSVEQRRRNAEREVARRVKAGHIVTPVRITGRRITTTVWGNAWCNNLESYHDYANRMGRGRSYVRSGAVIDLKISPRSIEAMVSGSAIYHVTISISGVSNPKWKSICTDCAGQINSLITLLQGRLSAPVMERLCRQDQGLFPRPSEIRFKCSCPDHAVMCKHIAAVLYGVGARLDDQPELLFQLRDVDPAKLIENASTSLPEVHSRPTSERILNEDDVATLFDIDIAEDTISDGLTLTPSRRPSAKQPQTAVPEDQPQLTKKMSTPRTRVVKTPPAETRKMTDSKPKSLKNPEKRAKLSKHDKPIQWWLPAKPPRNSKTKS